MSDQDDGVGARLASAYLTPVDGSIENNAASGSGVLTRGTSLSRPQLVHSSRDGSIAEQYFQRDFHELEVHFDEAEEVLWYCMNPKDRPSFTLSLLQELRRFQDRVREYLTDPKTADGPRISFLVVASSVPGVFNLGGDLHHLAKLIRAQNRKHLDMYARACIDVLYNGAVALDLPIITISLVHGQALGGGFEAALANQVIIAEECAKFGLPEILFNLFPGMGAYSLLARRIGMRDAERLITSGKVYSATELHEMGVVDVIAPPGQGEAALYDFVAQQKRRYNAHVSIYQTRQRFHPVTYDELRDITSIWVDAALRLGDSDLRRIDRLSRSQIRRKLRPVSGG